MIMAVPNNFPDNFPYPVEVRVFSDLQEKLRNEAERTISVTTSDTPRQEYDYIVEQENTDFYIANGKAIISNRRKCSTETEKLEATEFFYFENDVLYTVSFSRENSQDVSSRLIAIKNCNGTILAASYNDIGDRELIQIITDETSQAATRDELIPYIVDLFSQAQKQATQLNDKVSETIIRDTIREIRDAFLQRTP